MRSRALKTSWSRLAASGYPPQGAQKNQTRQRVSKEVLEACAIGGATGRRQRLDQAVQFLVVSHHTSLYPAYAPCARDLRRPAEKPSDSARRAAG